MPLHLTELVEPRSTAVLCMEMQRGVVGDLSPMAMLADAVRDRSLVRQIARLLTAARSAGVQVVYCNAVHRRDRKGSAINAPMLAISAKRRDHMIEGTASVDILAELAPQVEDFISTRYHGMTPFTGTALDAALRNMGIRNLIATGVSLNLGILGLCVEAVGLGYRVVIPREGVVGVPAEYGDAVLQNSLPALGMVTSVDDIVAAWASPTSR